MSHHLDDAANRCSGRGMQIDGYPRRLVSLSNSRPLYMSVGQHNTTRELTPSTGAQMTTVLLRRAGFFKHLRYQRRRAVTEPNVVENSRRVSVVTGTNMA